MLSQVPARRIHLLDPSFNSPQRTDGVPLQSSDSSRFYGFPHDKPCLTCTKTIQFLYPVSMNQQPIQTANGGDGLC